MEGMSSDAPETLRDRKIRDGRDSRSYQVSFAKFREYFPQIAQHRSLDVGVAALLEELRTHELTPEVFARSEFYRLQHLEKLVSSGAVGREAFADPN